MGASGNASIYQHCTTVLEQRLERELIGSLHVFEPASLQRKVLIFFHLLLYVKYNKVHYQSEAECLCQWTE